MHVEKYFFIELLQCDVTHNTMIAGQPKQNTHTPFMIICNIYLLNYLFF